MLKVIEVFPPLFPSSAIERGHLDLGAKVERFVEEARSLRALADVILVADVKNQDFLKFSTLEASAILKERLGVQAAPVIVARDMNRQRFLSTILTGLGLGLSSMMIVWGDRYPVGSGSTNVRDFRSLADAIRRASRIGKMARSPLLLFAPVDLNSLSSQEGMERARERLRAGADYLLAQPPTTDPGATFDTHSSLLGASGLKDKVLPNVFPFRSAKDVRECERYFGWRLPRALHEDAARGEAVLFEAERAVVRRLKREGFPGVYLSTRGTPSVARMLLS